MNRAFFKSVFISFLAAGFLAGTGCETEHHVVMQERPAVPEPTGEVVVSREPPPGRHEVVTAPPSTEHVWVPGYWISNDNVWVWDPGHWELRPQPGATYFPGHWDKTSRGWVWTPGHWG